MTARTILSERLDEWNVERIDLVTCGGEPALWLERASDTQRAQWSRSPEWADVRWSLNDDGDAQPFGDTEDLDDAIDEWIRCIQPSTDESLTKAF